jgi:uncharacterized protein with GYD domain
MPTYQTVFTYTKDSWRRMVERPEDRAAASRALVEAAGGTMIAFYWMLGEHDGLAIWEAPNAETAAAVNAAVAASGMLTGQRTTQLLTSDEAHRALVTAKVLTEAYRPPGAPENWRAGYDELG